MAMFSAFGMMIIARHQLLIEDNSHFKMRPVMKYMSYFAINCVMHIMTVSTVLSPIGSTRERQIAKLEEYRQLKWSTRGLNWFIFDGAASPALKDFTYYAFFIAVPLFCAFIILPFIHMLIIVLRARKNINREQRHKMAHLRQAQTIIMQGVVLLICLGIPFVPAVLSTLRDNVYANSQTSICIAEMVFVCSTLLNSIVILSRNRAYRQAIVQLFRTSSTNISPSVERTVIVFFYTVGSISLVVNSITLCIIVRKGSTLIKEVKILTIFQQLSCLIANAFFALLNIPLFYPRTGGGYCVGLLCLFFPYQVVGIVEVFLSMTMFSAFGMMVVARHQLLIDDNSLLKMRPFVKYVSYAILTCAMHILTVSAVLSQTESDRSRQILILDLYYKQLKWRERGLNWFMFDGAGSPALRDFTYYALFVAVPSLCAFFILPFIHMAARLKIRSELRQNDKHMRPAQTIIIQGLVLLISIGIPFVPAVFASLRDDVYADTQTSLCIAEMVFVCSTLFNSIVIVSRNRVYRQAVVHLFRATTRKLGNHNSINSIAKQAR